MLALVRFVHTAVWAFFVVLILALPVLGWQGRFGWAIADIAAVLLEGFVLALNRGRCPLTNVAARYTDDREANFDIYLPRWLAQHNKVIFTTLFLVGTGVVAWCWATR